MYIFYIKLIYIILLLTIIKVSAFISYYHDSFFFTIVECGVLGVHLQGICLKGTDHVGTFMGLKCVVYYANYRSGNQSSKIQVVP